jgi:hypothetical protein
LQRYPSAKSTTEAYDYPGQEAQGYADAEQQLNDMYKKISSDYYKVDETVDKIKIQTFPNKWMAGEQARLIGDSSKYTFDKYNIVNETASTTAAGFAEWISANQLQLAASYVNGGLNASTKRLTGLQDKAKYLSNWDKHFKQARLNVAMDTIDAKIAAYSTPAGYLNISERMDALASRIQKDFDEAFGRMRALEVGLSTVYGIGKNANAVKLKIPSLPKLRDGSTLDLSLAWVRAVHAALTQARRYDQKTIIPIDLKKALGGEAAFDSGLAQGR